MRDARPTGIRLSALIVLAGWTAPGLAAGLSCTRALGAPAVTEGPLKILEMAPAMARFPVIAGRAYLIEVEERDKDALIEILDSKNQVIARADHPERRTGTRRSLVTASSSSPLVVRVIGKERGGEVGAANVRVFALAGLRLRPDCLAAFTALARADADYATGEAARSTSSAIGGRDAFLRAVEGYSAAEQALSAPADRRLRGETALALAGLEYFDLQEWAKAAAWAEAAEHALALDDHYRKARADALLAAAWIEMGAAAPAGSPIPGYGVSSNELLARARTLLQRLHRFYQERGEQYDAGLQQQNIAVAYLDEGRYAECVTASLSASRLFASIREKLRRAEAWQDRALCLWGLGRLPEALRWLERSLADISPAPYPTIYLASITNTALANYALGRFDDSLRLYDQALTFTERIQSPRDEAYCLYGIGVNYYALGDRERASEFLEQSLAIRTVALDGRGRMASLRALATIDAEQGRVEKALTYDREALSLAVAPSAIARIEIQLATHTAAAGRPEEAKAKLDKIVAGGVRGDPAIQAEALLQRAVILRQMKQPRESLADIAVARPRLHAFGRLMEEFEADLELARVLRMVGKPDAALAAIDRALGHSDAVRLQTANPELRAQLQTPLRPAYELKLDLMRERYEHALAVGQQREANALAAAAFETADAARAHTLADVAAQKYPPAVRRSLAPEFRSRQELYSELAARRFALDTRLDRSGSADPRTQHLIADISELEREVDTVNTTIAARTMSPSPRTRSKRDGMNLLTLPPDTALVSYWLGSEVAYAWVIRRGEVHWARLPSPADIGTQAMAFHDSVTSLVDDDLHKRWLQDSLVLYTMVIRPLEPWLSDTDRWLIVPDGALDYVPFAALQARDSASSFVVLTHDIAYTPAAWRLDTSGTWEGPHARRSLLLVADPVYQANDPRYRSPQKSQKPGPPPQSATESAPGATHDEYQRLPFTGQEAAQIARQFAPADVDEFIGLDATRERVLSLDWSAYRFIHIATHGVVDAQVPQLSALILGSYDAGGKVADDAVRVADLSLQTLAADVVVLSACETALGKDVRSEGLVGLSSTMLARGARAVVASLWRVPDDEIGSRLMTDFYQHLLQDSLPPERALGAAMRSVVLRDRSADPARWAAFQVSVAALGPTPPGGGAETARIAAMSRH
jgi:CHAT domain-containing protein